MVFAYPKMSDIAYPNLVWMLRGEIAFQPVLFLLTLPFLVLPLGIGADADQVQLPHIANTRFLPT